MNLSFFKNNKIKVLYVVLIVIVIILLFVFLFLKLWVPLGGSISNEDRTNYSNRARNYKNGKFYNENNFKKMHYGSGKNSFISKKETIPIDEIPTMKPTLLSNPSIDELNVTWLGHSSLLLQIHGMNILIDPVFSSRTSPISFVGPSRFSKLPIEIGELPNIDIVVISHAHYDHLDYATIKAIDKKVDKYIVPLGVENHLERWEIDKNKIIDMAWWEETQINGLTIGCTPSRHYSARNFVFDSDSTLWASWVFMDSYYKVFESGDTGYDKHFREIYDNYGYFDLAMLDTGQYDFKWKDTHMTPEQAVQAGLDLRAKVIMPIHWGAYKLANHPWDDPVERFSKESEKQNIKYITPRIGQTIIYEDNMSTDKWWIPIN